MSGPRAMRALTAGSGGAHDTASAQPRSADNTVHDLIAISNDLRRHIDEHLRSRGYEDLRPSFAPLLSRIWDEPIAQSTLADELGVSVQAASQTVGFAEQAGYVTREPNPNDGRSKLVVLSGLGRHFVEHGAEAIATRAARYAEQVGARRLARFDAALVKLRAGLGLGRETGEVAPIQMHSSVGAVILLAERATDELRAAVVAGGHGAIRATHNKILVHVGPHGARASEIARMRGVSRQAITSMLHEIESLGYLSRRDDENDARGVVFALTGRGIRLVDDYIERIDAIEQRYESILGRARFAEFGETAHELRHRIVLDSTLGIDASRWAGGRRPSASRTDNELTDLATDLHRWLGDTDAARLGAMLTQLSIDKARLARYSKRARRSTEGRGPRQEGA